MSDYRTDNARALATFLAVPFADQLGTVSLSTFTIDGVEHLVDAAYCPVKNATQIRRTGTFSTASRTISKPAASGAVTFGPDLLAPTVCDHCVYALFRYSYRTRPGPLTAAETYTRLSTRLTSMLKVTKSTSATAVQKRISEIDPILRETERFTAENGAVSDAFDALRRSFEKAKETLRAVSHGDDARAKVEAKVQDLMVPNRFRGQKMRLDHSPALIGLSPTPTDLGRNNHVGAVLDAFAIRRDSVTVLVAPAYVYSFLLQQLFSKSTSSTLVVSAPAPESLEVRETAAGIWDPEGESALACISSALEAAQALSD